MKKYTFQMTKQELKELCFQMIKEQQRSRISRWLLIVAIIAFECIFFRELGFYIIAILLAIVFLFVRFIAENYARLKDRFGEKTCTIWVEEGMLKQDSQGGQYNEISCGSFTGVRRTGRLLILVMGANGKRKVWYPIPLRVFAQEQEIDRFVESIMGSQAQAGEGSIAFAKKEQGKVYFSFSFPLGEEEWVQMMTDAAEVIAAGTLGKQKKDHMAWKFLVAVFVGFLCWVAWKVPDGEGIAFVALFIGIIFLLLLRKQIEPPEKEIRRQVSRGTAQDSYGDWEVVITETGLWRSLQNISGKNIVMVPWESLLCMVETDRELFFFKKDKRGFFGLLKGDMEGKEQIESLKELCREKQLPILLGKQKKDTSRRILSLLTGIMIVGLIAGIFYVVYKSPQRNISPDYVSFEEQMFVLRSFGFTIPDELEETLWDYMEDDETKTYVEEYPYTWLLLNLAWGDVDQGTEVFWFDFESFDISTNYIWVLEGMKELSAGSILDSVENIQEDIEDMDWEKGTGTITVSLEWEGQEHSWEMNVENDWIDPKVLGIYNGMLEKEDVSERFYATFDDGQGALVFYCSKDWARAFENATGLNLEAYVEEFK